MRIAVTTPTGNVGRHVVQMLLRGGLRPTVLLRDPARLAPEIRDRVDAVAVDQRDRAAVVAATRGVDALFWLNPPIVSDDPAGEYARVGANTAAAVRENGIARTVFLSSVGAEKRHGMGEIDGLGRTEELLDATGASVAHLRCGYFFTNLLTQLDAIRAGVIPVVLPLDHPMAWVDPRDIAEVAVLWLLSTDWSGRHVRGVHGPEDLNWRQATVIVSEAIGRPLRAEQIPDDEMRQMLRGAGLSEGMVEGIMGMSTGQRDGFVPEQPRTVETTTPTSLASWAYAVLRPLL
ncbi:Uncharacterized conserved protein YbjT, contains NAD(P)-binding and DUF2867 domains [Streptoalloteichus tenebrarius]|uniref:Uncharacterized conserved protein YbjT, contains NAD(P)-binding and DUF2867 domains n=1 Tax=Streptoalloteichus tenebrarius (strain ATCC 17920 / DSM 40477 / JCM 4838 / CBS 697.72 / NBRC 16177 / NCIMB 11028 / NRRL B-12390 / A12253. 1 / ISP 5477) TaxID=1933 RepID=A0ABT1HP44_STRSD|nr:NAD(P)H-binding protein [Streptoalloteichus tenebrarius]MCP2257282.1 Uncharacterized conserved protein YbjT, contains NAD(P)-binding and DUF2867 domains [Streptoalloteichus tenebrarius]BFF04191.1 NAD(P)H-binding protein [Streptoalloteichus tenebrarius]